MAFSIHEMILITVCGSVLIPCTVMDIRAKHISLRLMLGAAAAGAAAAIYMTITGEENISELFLSVMPGTFLLLTSELSGGRIGEGDGLVFMVIGLLIGCRRAFAVLLLSLLLSALYSVFLLLCHKADRNTTIAWMPFVLGGYILWLIIEILMGGSGS